MADLEIDNLTLILLIAIAGLLLYDRIARPSPLVHPLLLGKQSEVSPVRKEGESAVYRSFATGHGTPLIVRPASSLKTVRDVIPSAKGREALSQRIILDTPLTDEALAELVRLLPLGLLSLFPSLSIDPARPTPIIVLLPPAPDTSLPLLLLSLACSPNVPLIILDSPEHLVAALTSSDHPTPGLVVVHESLVGKVMEQIQSLSGKIGVLVVGSPDGDIAGLPNGGKHGIEVRLWDEIWDAAETSPSQEGIAPQAHDIHSYFYSSVSGDTKPLVLRYTHLNFTAGIAGFLSSFPADKRPNASKKDSVASSESLNTPFGMTVALASIWSGVAFSLIGPNIASWEERLDPSIDTDVASILASPETSRPSILIIRKTHHSAMVKDLYRSYKKSSLGRWAIGSKSTDIYSGHLSRTGLWDRLVWGNIRNGVLGGLLGDRLRSIIVVGDAPSESDVAWSSVLLSLPTARMFISPFSAGPILSSHFYDIQANPSHLMSEPTPEGRRVHTGPPTSNVEVVLRGVVESSVVSEKRPAEGSRDGAETPIGGSLSARGPALGHAMTGTAEDGWVEVARDALVRTNGTFLLQ